jgi:hypothetical protein
MGYRGADLDLRTARTWSATSTDIMSGFDGPAPAQTAHGHGAGPIWVDETLLACANHAYDVAVAHRAGDVRLEHLLHALTRIEGAAAELEARGVRVAPLRRDSAVIIASEIPIGLMEDDAGPRRSPELEDVLRLAADHAAHASRPAGVGDVLYALIDQRSDIPGSALLLRHLPRGSRDFWSSLGSGRQQSRYASEVRLAEAAEPERLHGPAPAGQLARRAPRVEPRRPSEYTIMQGMLDRLAEIERAMSDRLEAVEVAVASATPATLDLDAVAQRLEVIEDAVRPRNGAGEAVLQERLTALERSLAEERAERLDALSALSADVKALVSALGCGTTDGSNQPSISERLQLLAADLERNRVEPGASLGDRIAAIEKVFEAQAEKAAAELAEVQEALTKLNVSQQLLAGSIDQWRSNESGEMHLINARIGAVQEDGTKRLEMLERLCADMEALSQLALEDQTKDETKDETQEQGFRRWLFGTDDWIKASWMKRSGS